MVALRRRSFPGAAAFAGLAAAVAPTRTIRAVRCRRRVGARAVWLEEPPAVVSDHVLCTPVRRHARSSNSSRFAADVAWRACCRDRGAAGTSPPGPAFVRVDASSGRAASVALYEWGTILESAAPSRSDTPQ